MKKIALLIIITGTLIGTISAQRLVLKTYVEKTNIGIKSGTAIGMENRHGWEYGSFFQESSIGESLMSESTKNSLPRFYEREFYGLYFAVPIMNTKYLTLKTQVRTGISNGENFAITPSILSEFAPNKHFRFGVGIGARTFRPTLQGSLSIIF